ncbi:tagaturonate reductase [Rhabdobacter roseus]|uniref:Tagaturonate reductase n=1 Tax=Rhabdobacter roseus TaxID=1655419 RepID=A0A840TPT2_9BACT|nr:tagaturonate reductase [Rhabdobacter roseus]MBB5282028.1 tagaturonate reductase [Rhabdobacter roseus]
MNTPRLTPQLLAQRPELCPDHERLLALPEKVIQFGTGVLLRGLPDYFINKANQQQLFNGRVVVVKSTDRGGVDAFAEQDNVFTQCIRGIDKGSSVDQTVINTAVSRTLSARTEWSEILRCAHNPHMQVVISNTTEVGIQLTDDDLSAFPPASFPGKLTAFLYERFRSFYGSAESGLVIVPTELVPNNGTKLREIVLEQARRHELGDSFIQWLQVHNHFCSSLVDRIVPGQPNEQTLAELTAALGYQDDLLIVSEVYRLWAIEGNEHVRSVLSFAAADEGVIIEPNIDLYRELKLRLLNGTHTLAVGLCYLAGFDTVRESMENPATERFIAELMLEELAPAIPYPVDSQRAQAFGNEVLDRFRNPYIRHQLIDITVQYTAKMQMRNVPTLLQHYQRQSTVPLRFAQGFAAYLLFMKATHQEGDKYFGTRKEVPYPIRCDAAPFFYSLWQQYASDTAGLVQTVLRNVELWGTDLTQLPGFSEAIVSTITLIQERGVNEIINPVNTYL